MFGWDFQNSKTDRIKLFFFILAVFLFVGFIASYVFGYMNQKDVGIVDNESQITAESTDSVDSSSISSDDKKIEEPADKSNEYDQTERFSEDQLTETEELAVEFVKVFHTYNADEPMQYLENAEPYMTDALYEKMTRTARREPLDRSYLTVKETQVTQVVNPSNIVVRWNVMVMGEAKSVDGKISETEDWYLVGLREVNGEWKVEDVRVNVPN